MFIKLLRPRPEAPLFAPTHIGWTVQASWATCTTHGEVVSFNNNGYGRLDTMHQSQFNPVEGYRVTGHVAGI